MWPLKGEHNSASNYLNWCSHRICTYLTYGMVVVEKLAWSFAWNAIVFLEMSNMFKTWLLFENKLNNGLFIIVRDHDHTKCAFRLIVKSVVYVTIVVYSHYEGNSKPNHIFCWFSKYCAPLLGNNICMKLYK